MRGYFRGLRDDDDDHDDDHDDDDDDGFCAKRYACL